MPFPTPELNLVNPSTLPWLSGWPARSPLFAPLAGLPQAVTAAPAWPDMHILTECASAQAVVNAAGRPLRFVAADTTLPYETAIFETGAVPTRPHNWHDFFNALAWLTWPRAKAALNALHIRAGVTPQRSRPRDALTLLDESGVAVACADPTLWQLLVNAQWLELFVARRAELGAAMGFHLIGHALYEKALNPYPAMTGKCIMVPVARDFFGLDAATRQTKLDAALARQLLVLPPRTPAEFPPLPVLGIPGATPANEHPDYYRDTRIFRPGRLSARTQPMP